ncbi:MAG: serine/threonine protein kinase [Acidobacteria bacterium]|nr:MAG: serine/threonine protein kinase [Acidobacteriota bacterium]
MELVGQQIGAYRVLSLLGRGGTAEVYKAFHPALKREVAVKVILREVVSDEDWVRRFRQEAELLGRLDHPHILPVYDAGEYEGRPYLVMKYMSDGATLRDQLSGQPWPLNRVVKVISQVAEALDAAHRSDVVHRDIKPSNILVTSDLRCLIFDFGIAKPFGRDEHTTDSGLIVGTPEFMSPEQCKGDKIDHRSDIYSLGVLTYQMLTGRVPFSAETAVGVLTKHLTEPLPIPPRGVALPPTVNAVLRKSMARDARDRFESAGELGDALRQSAEQPATVTVRAAEIRRAAPTLKLPAWVRQIRRRPVRVGAAAVFLAALLGAMYQLWPATSEVGTAGTTTTQNTRPVVLADTPPPATLGILHIASDAPGKVYLDGAPIGAAPGVFERVEPGARRVTVDAGDGRLSEKTVIVVAGSTHHVRFRFEQVPRDLTGGLTRDHQSDVPPARPRLREWSGFLTDADCGATGGKQGALHLRCAERCIRAGQPPMLYTRGKLYRLDGYEHLTIVRGEPLRFKGWLEADTIHVFHGE